MRCNFIAYKIVCMTSLKMGWHVALLLSVSLSVHHQFPFIFFAEDANIVIHFGYNRAIFDKAMPLGRRKIRIISSFCTFSSQMFQSCAVSIHFPHRCFQWRGHTHTNISCLINNNTVYIKKQ